MKPRVGFLGTGWIGRDRMAAITDIVAPVAICDPSPACRASALEIAPGAAVVPSFEAMLDLALDGIVIATPSALHAEQAIRALDAGSAVFCQKPLGRDAAEVAAVVAAARKADRLLGVDLSYRHLAATRAIVQQVQSGALGRIFAIDLTFHNAYGPDKDWFYNRAQSGGGCLIDLGVHLVDLALWLTGFPAVEWCSSALYAGGAILSPGDGRVEDYAAAQIMLEGGIAVRLACSWRLHAGQEAVIAAKLHGTEGGAVLRNVGGSFYDFTADALSGTTAQRMVEPPDAWGGRAARAWAERLAQSPDLDASAEDFVQSAEVLDRLYAGR